MAPQHRPQNNNAALFALPYILENGDRGVLVVNKQRLPVALTLHNISNVSTALVLEAAGAEPEPGFAPPIERMIESNNTLHVGAFAVAIVKVANQDGR